MLPAPSPARPAAVLLVCCLAVFLLPLSLTGASVALPDIGRELGADPAATQWVVGAYNVCFASFMLAAGGLADVVGRRRLFRGGLALFVLGGVGGALARDVVVLDAARAAAGVGAAAVTTSASAILAQAFQGADRARAFGVFGTTLGAGIALGPLVCGVLVSALGWRAVFAGLGLLAAGAIAGSRVLGESRDPDAEGVDVGGTVTFTGALVLLVGGLLEVPVHGWTGTQTLAGLAGAVLLLAAFVAVESRVRRPMFDLGLLAERRFVGVSLVAVISVAVLVPLLVHLPAYLIAVHGVSTTGAGLVLLMLTLPTLVLPALAGDLARRVALRPLLVGAIVLMGLGVAGLGLVDPRGSFLVLLGPLLVVGAAIGVTLGVVDGAAISTVPAERAGMAAGMFNTLRLSAETTAIAVTGTVLVAAASSRSGRLAGDPTGDYTHALHTVAWVTCGVVVLAALIAARLLREPGVASPPAAAADDELDVVEGEAPLGVA